MGREVEAAQEFARAMGGRAIICVLADIAVAVLEQKGATIGAEPIGDDGVAFHLVSIACASTAPTLLLT